jgi:hypothetical protein
MTIGMYDDRILPTIRELLTEEAKISSEKAQEAFSDIRLKMVRYADPRTFQEWTNRANARLEQSTPPSH